MIKITTLEGEAKYVNLATKLSLIVGMYNDLASNQSSHQALNDYLRTTNHLSDNDLLIMERALEILAKGDFEEKWSATKILVKYGNYVITPLKDVILNENASLEHRCFGLRILSQLKNPEITLMVTELLMKTEEEELIALATQTLAVQGKEAIAFLANLLEQDEYRLLAAKALSQIPSKEVIEPLLSIVNDQDSEIRIAAISALRNFNHPQVVNSLLSALQDYNAQVRKEALVGLGLRLKNNPETSIINAITPLLSDINLYVAQQAAMSLNRCRHPLAISALEEILQSNLTPLSLKITVVRVLAWIATEDSIEAMSRLITNSEPEITLEMIKVLGRVNQSELINKIITILIDFYHHQSSGLDNSEIIQALCYSWTQLHAKEALPLLRKLELSDNAKVRFHAQSAINALL